MPHVEFAASLQRHVSCAPVDCEATSLRQALEAAWQCAPRLRGYVLDEQGHIRKHVAVFINGELVRFRDQLARAVGPADVIYVAQALSGG
jgi:sulfur-carrier protein